MALENFVEMRDLVANKNFILQREAQLKIEEKYSDFTTRYGLISFTNTPYYEALMKGRIHRQVLSNMT